MKKFKDWDQSELAAIRFLHHIDTHYDSLVAIRDKLPKRSKLLPLLDKLDSVWWLKSWSGMSPTERSDEITKAVVDYNMVLASAKFMSHPDYQQYISKKDLTPKDAIIFVDIDIHEESKKFIQFSGKADAEMTICGLFNHAHAVVKYNSQTLVVKKYKDHKGNINYSFSLVKDLRVFYQNIFVSFWVSDTKVKQESAFDIWLKSPQRKTFSDVIFDPTPNNNPSDKYLNLWDGLALPAHPSPEFPTVTAAAMSEEHELSKILNHLFVIVCKSRVSEYKYLLALLSQWIKEPHKKNGVAIVLKSEGRGTGKSTIGKILKRIFGHHWYMIQSVEQLVGRFNGAIANKVVLVAEEAFWGGSLQHAGKLRTLVTDGTITIEGKHKDGLNLDSYHRFVFFTNNDWVVPASFDERRFFVLNVSEERKQDKKYFDSLHDAIDSDQVVGQLIDFLINYDSSNIDTRTALRTEEFFDQVEMSLPEEAKWWGDVIYEGEVTDPEQLIDNRYSVKEGVRIPKIVLYNAYLKNVRNKPSYQVLTQARFGRFINDMTQMKATNKIKDGHYSGKLGYDFKSIEELALMFKHKYGVSIINT